MKIPNVDVITWKNAKLVKGHPLVNGHPGASLRDPVPPLVAEEPNLAREIVTKNLNHPTKIPKRK